MTNTFHGTEKYKTAGEARTIGELSVLLSDVIAEHGPDCVWWGWDTGTLIIETPEKIEIYIEPVFGK